MTEPNDAVAGDGVGEELARARAALGFSVKDVAQQLKFAPRQIEALEQGRFEELPAGTFARGMVRAYARLLKLDAEPLVERIAERVAVPDNAAAVATARRPIPITDSARRSNTVYAALSLAILAVIAGVVFQWQRERAGAARLTFVAAADAPSQAPQAPQSLPSRQAPQALPAPVPTSAEPQRLASVSAGPTGIAPAAQAEAPAKAPAAPAEGSRRIALKFERESWVEIRGRDGKTLISQLNPGGSERVVDGKPPFALIIGNAQYVRMTYDDRPVDLAPYVKVEVARFTLD
jgi:cytoskeleton protein RodZ